MKKQLLIILWSFFCASSLAWTVSPVANIEITGNIKPPAFIVNEPGLIPDAASYSLPSIIKLPMAGPVSGRRMLHLMN